MIAVIQDVRLSWTKRSRSGLGARRRSVAPKIFELPEIPRCAAPLSVVFHTIHLDEATDFTPVHHIETEAWTAGRTHRIPGFTIRISPEGITVVFAWEWEVGAPERSKEPRQVLSVPPGRWGQAAYNGRYTTLLGLDDWKYHQQVVNLCLTDQATTAPFAGPPIRSFQSLVELR